MKFKENAFELLQERGFVRDITHADELKSLLKKGPVTFYLGIDPTADSLHIGHFFAMRMFRILQDCGHKGILLVGGATAMVGDPSFKSDMRKMMTQDEVDRNVREINAMLHRFIVLDGDNPAIVVNNADWIRPKGYVQFLREVGVHFNISKMLTYEAYKARLGNGLTFLEMGYMLMQAYDFVHLNDAFGCILQIGGTDQWANIVAGVDLSRKMAFEDGRERPAMIGLCCPLLTNADGVKMGKTEKGTLWVSRERSTAFDFFQHFVNCMDADVEQLLRFFTDLPIAEIKQMCKTDIVKAKKLMACEVTKLVHGEQESGKAADAAAALFGGGADLSNVPTVKLDKLILSGGINIIELVTTHTNFISSKSEARRLIEQGGLMINENKINKIDEVITAAQFKDNYILIKKGKKNFLKVEF